MSSRLIQAGQVVVLWLVVLLMTSCAVPRIPTQATEALILQDGSEVPCRIIEINDQDIIIETYKPEDAYRYGDRVPVGQVKWIVVYKGRRANLYTVDEYLRLYADQFEEIAGEPESPAPETPAQTETPASSENQPEAGREPRPSSRQTRNNQPDAGGPGLRFQSSFLDTARYRFQHPDIGLRLPQPPMPQSILPSVNYADIADFIVISGAAGLVLYRAEKLAEEGIKLSPPRQSLVDAIRSSALWKERKKGLRAAHLFAARKFQEKFKELAPSLRKTFGFRARGTEDPFVQFLIFLHTHGNLSAKKQRLRLQQWLGKEAVQAILDLLHNFDDWYYIAVVSAKPLKL